MFGGIWKKHSSGEIPKGADQQFKLSPEELLALERRTHPLTCERDHIDPIIYSALEIRAQVNRGERLRWSAALSCPASAHGKWWARRSSRPPGATCAGSARASGSGGTRLLQITGWHKDKATCLQLVMDEPPEQLYNQWIRDRMEFYKRVEPTEPPQGRAASPWTPCMRFSSSNGLGDVSTALWSVILSNPEKSGLAAIHSVAKEAILKGESR